MVSLLNPVFEELFVRGYLMTVFAGHRSAWLGLNISVGVRLAYHPYQGIIGVMNVIPIGLLFGLWFRRARPALADGHRSQPSGFTPLAQLVSS